MDIEAMWAHHEDAAVYCGYNRTGFDNDISAVFMSLAEILPRLLHDLDGTQHHIIHATGYDGESLEGIECITGLEGHQEDADDLMFAIMKELKHE